MNVIDIVSRSVPSVHERTGPAVAADLLVEGGLGTLPVTDCEGRLSGVLSEGDVLWDAVSRPRARLGPQRAQSPHTGLWRSDGSLPTS